MKILNLYAGIGGNRKLWGGEHIITAIEINPDIAAIYQELFPRDKVIVTDAHEYLLNHFQEYDFIWSSPPCQTHSRFNFSQQHSGIAYRYPDMKLYEEIIFLKTWFKGKWVVENVNPYYIPLIQPTIELQRHLFWSNFYIPDGLFKSSAIRRSEIPDLQNLHGIDLSKYKIKNKRQILRNCVLPELGLHIFESLRKADDKYE